MGRPLRITAGGLVYHVLNRANARMRIFDKGQDYEAFERILDEAVEHVKMRLLAYCVMPNHWHLVVWPRRDGDLSAFVGWLTLTHTQRWCKKGARNRFFRIGSQKTVPCTFPFPAWCLSPFSWA